MMSEMGRTAVAESHADWGPGGAWSIGAALALFILPWSAMICSIRLWRRNLTPGWMSHVLNNIVAYLVLPSLHLGQHP